MGFPHAASLCCTLRSSSKSVTFGGAELGLTYVSWFYMAEHRFKVGDLVRVQDGVSTKPDMWSVEAITCNRPSGIHEVTRLLPSMSNSEAQYLIKGCAGQPERIIGGSQLTSAVYVPQPRR